MRVRAAGSVEVGCMSGQTPSPPPRAPNPCRPARSASRRAAGARHPVQRRSRSCDRRARSALSSAGAMSTCVVTGGAGFLGSHLCDHLLGAGHRVICLDNLDTGSLQNIEHIRDPTSSRSSNHDLTEPLDIDERGRLRLPPRLAGEPDRLRAPAAAHAQGRLLRDPPHARPGEVQAGALPARLDLGGLRRPRRSTPSPRTTGATSTRSARAASTTRPSATPRR